MYGVVYVKHFCVWTPMKNSQHEICSNVPGSPLHAKEISQNFKAHLERLNRFEVLGSRSWMINEV